MSTDPDRHQADYTLRLFYTSSQFATDNTRNKNDRSEREREEVGEADHG